MAQTKRAKQPKNLSTRVELCNENKPEDIETINDAVDEPKTTTLTSVDRIRDSTGARKRPNAHTQSKSKQSKIPVPIQKDKDLKKPTKEKQKRKPNPPSITKIKTKEVKTVQYVSVPEQGHSDDKVVNEDTEEISVESDDPEDIEDKWGESPDDCYVVNQVRAVSMRVPIKIANQEMKAVIDTGAEVTVISQDAFQSLSEDMKPEVRKADRGLVVAAKDQKMGNYGMADVKFKIGKKEFTWPMYIAPIAEKMLLGADFLDHFDMTVNFKKGISIDGEWIQCKIKRRSNRVQNVRVSEKVTIPAEHEMIIPAVLDEDFQLEAKSAIIEPVRTYKNLNEVAIARIMVDPKQSTIPVRCANLGNKPVTLRPGQLIGEVQPVTTLAFLPGDESSENIDPVDISSVLEENPEFNVIRQVLKDVKRKDKTCPPCIPTVWSDTEEKTHEIDVENIDDAEATIVTNGTQELIDEPKEVELRRVQFSPEELKDVENKVLPYIPPGLPEYLHDLYLKSCEKIENAKVQEKLGQLLIKHKNVFAKDKSDLGYCDLVEHEINTGMAAPIREPMRRVPRGFESEEEKCLQQQLDIGVLVPSKSPWSSSCVLVRKKDQSVRWCGNYVSLNARTVRDCQPLPRIDNCLESLGSAHLYSCLDLQSGYWQIKMSEKDREKTAIRTSRGLLEYTRMPFGLVNATATFQRCMQLVLRGLEWKIVMVYVDDTIIYSGPDPLEHLEKLEQVLARLESAGFKLKPSKCELMKSEVTFLGHVIGHGAIKTNPTLIEKVKNWREPKNRKEIQQFLGLGNYYRRFILQYSDIAAPMIQLTKKDVPFKWTAQAQRSFDELKDALCNAPILALPRDEGEYILDTDASLGGISGVLSQIQDGEERVICYGSKTLNQAQRNYCTTRRELLAAVVFLHEYEPYLLGQRSFTLRTDHSSLRWLFGFRNPQGQLARFLEYVSRFSFKIVHRPGRNHGNSDALSRTPEVTDYMSHQEILKKLPCEACSYCTRHTEEWKSFTEDVDDVVPLSKKVDGDYHVNAVTRTQTEQQIPRSRESWVRGHTEQEMHQLQMADADLKYLHLWFDEGEPPRKEVVNQYSPAVRYYYLNWDRMKRENGVIYMTYHSENEKGKDRNQLLIPRVLRKEVLEMCHNSIYGGHFGMSKTCQTIRQRFYWYGVTIDVKHHIHTCRVCSAQLKPKKKYVGGLGSYRVGYPLDRIGIDVMGPFPESARGNKYILLLSDYFTRWTEAYALPDQKAETVADTVVKEFISRFGAPLQIHSDQGRNFESELFQEVCRMLGIDKSRTTPYRPCSNGLAERNNGTVVSLIRNFMDENQKDWDLYLPLLTAAYRSTEHPATHYTPNYLMLGREVHTPVDLMFPSMSSEPEGDIPEYVQELKSRMEECYDVARRYLKKSSEEQKRRYDTKIKEHPYQPGDLVYRKNPNTKKLETPWHGPYVVIQKLSDILFRITGKTRSVVIHHDQLKPYPCEYVPRWAKKIQQDIKKRTC